MRVGIATDHGGFGLKQELVTHLRTAGHEVLDFGAHRLDPHDEKFGFHPERILATAKELLGNGNATARTL
jgi:ribose 5-phosphate isomerase RpiB